MIELPETGYLRINHIIGNKKRGITALYPVSRSTLHDHIKEGRFPKPIYLSSRLPVWKVEDIRAFFDTNAVA